MKFVKGVIVGGVACTTLALWYADGMKMNKKKMMRKGRHFIKKMGMM